MALPDARMFAELVAQTGLLADTVGAVDPRLPVPRCPEWTVTELAAHVGRGQRWAAVVVERRATTVVHHHEADDREPPRDPAGLAGWLRAGAARLADAVRDAGTARAVWTWSTDRTAGFWLHKITHGTLVHRLDADIAAGRAPWVAADLAADGVSDLLATVATLSTEDSSDPVFAALRGDGETLHFHATDEGLGEAGEWLVRRTPVGVRWTPGHAKGAVAVRGPATDLLLVLNRRVAPDAADIEVLGDTDLFTHWLAHSAF